MATTYTVKPGDTLSKIGKRFGVDWRKITGYRSGNPNLIYPGEVLTIPTGETTTPTTTPTTQPTQPTGAPTIQRTAMDWQTALQKAKEMKPDFSDIYKTYADLSAQLKQMGEEAAKRKEEQIPLVTNIYSKLAESLSQQETEEKETKQKEKTMDVGTMAARAAASGFSTIEGFKADELRNLAADYDRQVAKIADKYRISRERLAAEEAKDIKDLQSEAEQLRASGLTAAASLTEKIADLKLQEENLITKAAQAIMTSQDKSEANYWKSLYQEALLGIKEQQLALQVEKIAMGKQYALVPIYNLEGTKVIGYFNPATGETKYYEEPSTMPVVKRSIWSDLSNFLKGFLGK